MKKTDDRTFHIMVSFYRGSFFPQLVPPSAAMIPEKKNKKQILNTIVDTKTDNSNSSNRKITTIIIWYTGWPLIDVVIALSKYTR